MSDIASLPISSWPVGRKAVAGVFAVATFVALSCAAVYLSAVLFLVLNKTNPRQAKFTSIVHYWDLYTDDARLRKKLVGSMAVSALGLLVVLPGALFAASRPRRPLHGDARFANATEVASAGLLSSSKASSPSILVGRYRGKFLALPGQLSVMLSAPTRSGKGVGVVVPNLLNWPD
jgi:type IV secretion system protein VirD4